MPARQIINDRREDEERRNSAIAVQFPIITTEGSVIRTDRRSTPERRLSNIVVKEWSIKSSIFEALFEDSKEKNNKK